jgi:hypothetical protein
LIDCAAAGRMFGAPIGLPDGTRCLPRRWSASSLDHELQEEMEGSPALSPGLRPSRVLIGPITTLFLLRELVATLDQWVQGRPAPKRTFRYIVLERLEEAGPRGSKAAAIRDYARDPICSAISTSRLLGWLSTALPRKSVRVGWPPLVPGSAGPVDEDVRSLGC